MNRLRYRIFLISLALAAAVFGLVYCVSKDRDRERITEGTLVWQTEYRTWEEPAA